jgi:hypothetical protein
VRLIGEEVNAQVASLLCNNRPTVALVGDDMFDRMNIYYGLAPRHTALLRNRVLAPRLKAAGCRVAIVP